MKNEKETIAVIKEKLFSDEISAEWLVQIKQDERVGVQKLIQQYEKKRLKEKELHDNFVRMSFYENKLRENEMQWIAGVDEVGRGPLAGPVVSAAVVLPEDFYLPGLNDSEQLNEQKREEFFEYITEHALAYGLGIVSATEIDLMNIHQASLDSMRRAVEDISFPLDHLLVDAMEIHTIDYPQTSITQGDEKSISIAAASVVAKVTRDRIMREIAIEYPQYGFDNNMGYGTKEHLEALKTSGSTPYHRMSFSPVKELVR